MPPKRRLYVRRSSAQRKACRTSALFWLSRNSKLVECNTAAFYKVKFAVPRVAGGAKAVLAGRGGLGSVGQPGAGGRASFGEIGGGHGRPKSFVAVDDLGVRKKTKTFRSFFLLRRRRSEIFWRQFFWREKKKTLSQRSVGCVGRSRPLFSKVPPQMSNNEPVPLSPVAKMCTFLTPELA
jgi:hypothetical protein